MKGHFSFVVVVVDDVVVAGDERLGMGVEGVGLRTSSIGEEFFWIPTRRIVRVKMEVETTTEMKEMSPQPSY